MTRFSQAFGDKYESAINKIRTRTFTYGDFEFKVRLPLSVETEAMYKRMAEIDDAAVDERVKTMTEAIRANPPRASKSPSRTWLSMAGPPAKSPRRSTSWKSASRSTSSS